jgi:hypothetical protein
MAAFVAILEWHPSGAPWRCVEIDDAADAPKDAVVMTTNEYRAQQPAWRAQMETWRAAHPEPEPEPEPEPRVVSALEFRRRLPFTRRVELTALAQSNATLRAWLDDVTAAQEIDLDDPELVAALAALETQGVLTAAEVAALRGFQGGG